MDKSNVKTLADLVRHSAEEFGSSTFLKEKRGKEIVEKSHTDLYEDCKRLNGFLKPFGKLHAAVIGATSYNYLVSWFGTSIGGNTVVPLDAQLVCEDICELLNRADVTVFFYDPRFGAMLDKIKAECPAIHTYICLGEAEGSLALESVLKDAVPAEPAEITPDMLAGILFTSGTTGKSKGVMLSHGNYIDNTFCRDNESEQDDVLLTVLPIHHVYCFTCDILLSLRYGNTICVNDSMMRIGVNLKLFKPTVILLVPLIAETIYKQIKAASAAKPDIPIKVIADAVFGGRLKGIYSGGAYLAPEIIEAYAEFGIPIAQGYGMTECSPRISSITFSDGSFGDVGIIVNGCQVRIEDGEIVVKSPSVMQGYYKDPEATAEALTPDGWLHTGDLGYVENNRIFITGRKKNLIILSNGENVSPEEVENKFAGKDLVSEVLVYAEDGVITAEVYPNQDYTEGKSREEIAAELTELIKKINTTLTSSKTVRKTRLRDVEFDKTTSKKIRRAQSIKGDLI